MIKGLKKEVDVKNEWEIEYIGNLMWTIEGKTMPAGLWSRRAAKRLFSAPLPLSFKNACKRRA